MMPMTACFVLGSLQELIDLPLGPQSIFLLTLCPQPVALDSSWKHPYKQGMQTPHQGQLYQDGTSLLANGHVWTSLVLGGVAFLTV